MGDILAGVLLVGPLLVKQRQRREEEHRRCQEAERRHLDDNRWRRFTELAARRR